MFLSYTGLFLFALLFIIAGFIHARLKREGVTAANWLDWEGDTLAHFNTVPPAVPMPEPAPDTLAGCRKGAGDIRCDIRGIIYEAVSGTAWPASYPTVAALDRAVTYLGDSLLLAAPEQADSKAWRDAIVKATDNVSILYTATGNPPTLDRLEAIAKDAWMEGCAPR